MMRWREVFLPVVFLCMFFCCGSASANTPPDPVSQPFPADQTSSINPQNLILSWVGGDTDAGDLVTYDVYFGTSAAPPFYASTNDPWLNLGPLDPMQTYYWRVIARDTFDAETTGPVWTFSTGSVVLSNVNYISDAILTKDRSPYIVQGAMTVHPGVVLTIEPGTVLKFGSGASLSIDDGGLAVAGTAADKIVFTSNRNDQYGGDTNDDGSTSLPAAGDWDGIHFNIDSETAAIDFTNCIVEYSSGIKIASTSDTISLTVQDCAIRSNSEDGIHLDGSANRLVSLELMGNQITDNTKDGLYFLLSGGTASVQGNISGNTFSSNGSEAVYFYNNSAESDLSFTSNTVQNHQYHGIWLDNYTNGDFLIASNTVSNSGVALALVAFAGKVDFTVDANQLHNGSDGIHVFSRGDVLFDASLTNNSIHHNNDAGIRCLTSSNSAVIEADIDNNLIYSNAGDGIEFGPWFYSSQPLGHNYARVTSNHIYDNGGWGITYLINDPVHVFYNQIHGNDGGIELDVNNVVKINFNDIHDNSDWNIYSHSNINADIQKNYWGPEVIQSMESLKNVLPYPYVDTSYRLYTYWGPVFDFRDWLIEPIQARDVDADRLPDAWEEDNGLNAAAADSDGDQIDDGQEFMYWAASTGWHTDPDSDGLVNLLDPDADNDGVADGTEISVGTPADIPPSAGIASYENAEDGMFSDWSIYDGDPKNASVDNIFDEDRSSRVIELSGESTITGFALRNRNGSPWYDASRPVLTFDLKISGYIIIYIDLETNFGQRYLRYEPVDWSGYGSGQYVHYGIGSEMRDGVWHTICRNLQADLAAAQPGIIVQNVNGFLMRGSGRLDDISLMTDAFDADNDGLTNLEEIQIYGTRPDSGDTDQDGLGDYEEVDTYGTDPLNADSDGDGLTDLDEVAYWNERALENPQNDWWGDYDDDGLVNLLDADADNDGVPDGHEATNGYLPLDETSSPALVYEDAQDGSKARWDIYDGSQNYSRITNVLDSDRQSRVIELEGNGTDYGFRLLTNDGQPWHNSHQTALAWKMQSTDYFIIYVDVQTTAGQRYLMYTPSVYDELGNSQYVHHGLGSHMSDGQWHTVIRDLELDLHAAQPDAAILEVNGFLFRGSGRFDDICLMGPTTDTDQDGLTDVDELSIHQSDPEDPDTDSDQIPDGAEVNTYGTDPAIADSDADGLADGDELSRWQDQWNQDPDADGLYNLIDTDSDNDGAPDGVEFAMGYDPADETDLPITVYEDAEDHSTDGWQIYDGNPSEAAVSNVSDAALASRVIDLQGNGTAHGFVLMNADGSSWQNTEQFTLDWRMNAAEYFIIYIEMQTSAGIRYLKYTPSDYNDLGTGQYVHFGLGASAANGTWQTFSCDLEADLNLAQPGVDILEVNGFLVRGSMRLDDIRLRY